MADMAVMAIQRPPANTFVFYTFQLPQNNLDGAPFGFLVPQLPVDQLRRSAEWRKPPRFSNEDIDLSSYALSKSIPLATGRPTTGTFNILVGGAYAYIVETKRPWAIEKTPSKRSLSKEVGAARDDLRPAF